MDVFKKKKAPHCELVDELKRLVERQRIKKNLSIRGLALRAGVSSGRISEILNGKRPLTKYYWLKIIESLRLDPHEYESLKKKCQEMIVQKGERRVRVRTNLKCLMSKINQKSYAALIRVIHRFEKDLALLLLKDEFPENLDIIIEIESTSDCN